MLVQSILVASLMPLAAAYDNGLAKTPPMGWNTWCTDDACGLLDRCTEGLVKSIADAMVEQNMTSLGYEYVLMDDCWSAKERDSQGRLQPNKLRFPSGMKALADYVHSKGLKIGLYTCVGTYTCKNKLPGSYQNFEIDANTVAEWGMDLVKADFCNAKAPARELYTNFSRALNATGRPILFSLCEWGNENVTEWGGELGQMFRIQMDHIPFWHYPKTKGVAGAGIGQGTGDIIEYVSTLKPSSFVRPHAWLDPDFLETLFPITMDYTASRTEMSFWCLWSAPLIVATDVRKMSTEKRSILMNPEVIAIDQDALGVAGDIVARDDKTGAQVWAKPLHNGDFAVILYNRNRIFKNAHVSVAWKDLPGFPKEGTAANVRDLWSKRDIEEAKDSTGYDAEVAPRDVVFLRVTPAQAPSLDE